MSSMTRILGGDVQVHHLRRDEQMIEPSLLARHGPARARTLVKAGSFDSTDGTWPERRSANAQHGRPAQHSGARRRRRITVLGQPYQLAIGELIVLAAGVEHAARSIGGCTLLLTVVHTETDGPSPVE